MRPKRLAVFSLLVLVAGVGCRAGSRVASFEPATTPRGTQAMVTTQGPDERIMAGELIAVMEDGLLLLLPDGLTLVSFGAIRTAEFEDVVGVGRWREEGRPEQRVTLAQFSRYPFGVDDEHLQRLLVALGPGELRRVDP